MVKNAFGVRRQSTSSEGVKLFDILWVYVRSRISSGRVGKSSNIGVQVLRKEL